MLPAIVALAFLVSCSLPAHAEPQLQLDFTIGMDEPKPRVVKHAKKPVAKATRPASKKKRHARRSKNEPGPRVAAWQMRAPDADKFKLVCMGPVKAKGSQWINEQGALEAAKKDWREEVRAEWGEKWTTIELDALATKTCWTSGINEGGLSLHRCEVIARPCRAPVDFLNPTSIRILEE